MIRLPKNLTIVGTFRKCNEQLKDLYCEFNDMWLNILSPNSVEIVKNEHNFVYMKGETIHTIEELEMKHLFSIIKSDYVWLFAPNGYVGYTALSEICFALATGKNVFTDSQNIPDFLKRGAVTILPEDTKMVNKDMIIPGVIRPHSTVEAIKLALDRKDEDYRKAIEFIKAFQRID